MSATSLWNILFPNNNQITQQQVHVDNFIDTFSSYLFDEYGENVIPGNYSAADLVRAAKIHNEDDMVTRNSIDDFGKLWGPVR